jgi:hypothetical protein
MLEGVGREFGYLNIISGEGRESPPDGNSNWKVVERSWNPFAECIVLRFCGKRDHMHCEQGFMGTYAQQFRHQFLH